MLVPRDESGCNSGLDLTPIRLLHGGHSSIRSALRESVSLYSKSKVCVQFAVASLPAVVICCGVSTSSPSSVPLIAGSTESAGAR